MEKKCNNCGTNENMTKVTMSSADWQLNEQRHERREKRLVWVIVLLIVLLVGTNVGWLVYESQFEVVEETITTFEDVVQESAEGSNNIVGGDFVNGEANN
jgi:predicted nucleic acid-binding Zn ribbon protein